MRIATGGIIHETSTLVETRTTIKDFEFDRGIIRGEAIIDHFRGTNVCTGGFITGADTFGFELVGLLRASAFPGGLILRADYDALKAELLELGYTFATDVDAEVVVHLVLHTYINQNYI